MMGEGTVLAEIRRITGIPPFFTAVDRKCIRRRRGRKKGGGRRKDRPLPRRAGHKDHRGRGRARQPGAVRDRSRPGARSEGGGAPAGEPGVRGLVGDRAFGAGWLLEKLDRRESEAVIPAKRNRAEPGEHNRTVYSWRNLVDSFFARIREFRAVVTRYDSKKPHPEVKLLAYR